MTNEELDREIERAARNARKLAALEAQNERDSAAMSALCATPPSTPTPAPRAVRLHPAAVRV